MLELAILGLLKEQDLHGYELKRRLGDTLGALSGVSFGSLYPALRRLEHLGAIAVAEGEDEVGIPMTGSLSGERAAYRHRRAPARSSRGRKVYRITEEGHRLFAELLSGSGGRQDDGRGFGLRLAFARHLSPDARLRLLERRRAELLARLERWRDSVRSERLDAYARALVEHRAETTEGDISWLDRLIAAERARVVAAGPGAPTTDHTPSGGRES